MFPDFEPDDVAVCQAVAPYTMTSRERVVALCRAVEYVRRNDIPGAIVECGVWKGGSMMAAALTLIRSGGPFRPLYLFDTFSGMPPPGALDVTAEGRAAAELLAAADRATSLVWGVAGLLEVRTNLTRTRYDPALLNFVPGRVEDTLPAAAPERIAVLRLDTDWYESTYHELVTLFPRLVPGGVLIVDDYGHWQGARAAVDRYLQEHRVPLLLNRIDYTGRIGVKLAL